MKSSTGVISNKPSCRQPFERIGGIRWREKKTPDSATVDCADPEHALSALKDGHRKVEELFQKYTDAQSSDEKAILAKQVCAELLSHTDIEEAILLST